MTTEAFVGYAERLAVLATFASVLSLPFAFVRRTARFGVNALFYGSRIVAVVLWVRCTVRLWLASKVLLVFGVCLCGVGTVPLAVGYYAANRLWVEFWDAMAMGVVAFVFRAVALYAASRTVDVLPE